MNVGVVRERGERGEGREGEREGRGGEGSAHVQNAGVGGTE